MPLNPTDEPAATAAALALTIFPNAVVWPDAGCAHCQACQLITAVGVGLVTVHAPNCIVRADL